MTTETRRRYEGTEGTKTERIDALPTRYLECRSLGHAWAIRWWGSITELPEGTVPPVVRAFKYSKIRVSTCQRCGTIRDEFFPKTVYEDPDSHRTQYRRYRYAGGYTLDGIGTSPARSLFNQAAYERWKLGDTEFHT